MDDSGSSNAGDAGQSGGGIEEAAPVSCPIPRMPNVKALDPDLQARIERGGDPVEIRQLGHAPELYKKFLAFYSQMHYKGSLELRVKEIARLRIAELNRCHY